MKKKVTLLLLALVMIFAMALNVSAAGMDVSYTTAAACKVADSNTVNYTATLKGVPTSDDGAIHLYELRPYQYTIPAGAAPIASVPASANPAFSFSLNHKQANTRLYSKFALAVNVGGVPTMIANPQYITNPEVLATHTKPRINLTKTTQNENIVNLHLQGTGSGPIAGKPVVQLLVKDLNVVAHPNCFIPDSHPIHHQYYMFNAGNDAGIAALAADLTYQAANSKGQDYLVGNEMNERIWNYMSWCDWDTYTKIYTQAFRVCYNAIKSEDANAKLYISLDQNWDRNRPTNHSEYYTFIDGKDFLDKFNAEIIKEGNIDWSMSIHPYTVPLTYAKFWNMGGVANGGYYAAQVNSNKMVSFQNMSVITNYFTQPQFLNPQGQIRTIIINEIGLSADQGRDIQAAAIAASWVAYKKNPYISMYMYLSNIGDGVDSTLAGQSMNMYAALGTEQEPAMLEWAKGVIGISDWNQILR